MVCAVILQSLPGRMCPLLSSIILITKWLLNIIFCLWPRFLLRSILLLCVFSNFLCNTAVFWASQQWGFPVVTTLGCPPFSPCPDLKPQAGLLSMFHWLLHFFSFLSIPTLANIAQIYFVVIRLLIKTLLPRLFIWGTHIRVLYHGNSMHTKRRKHSIL